MPFIFTFWNLRQTFRIAGYPFCNVCLFWNFICFCPFLLEQGNSILQNLLLLVKDSTYRKGKPQTFVLWGSLLWGRSGLSSPAVSGSPDGGIWERVWGAGTPRALEGWGAYCCWRPLTGDMEEPPGSRQTGAFQAFWFMDLSLSTA